MIIIVQVVLYKIEKESWSSMFEKLHAINPDSLFFLPFFPSFLCIKLKCDLLLIGAAPAAVYVFFFHVSPMN